MYHFTVLYFKTLLASDTSIIQQFHHAPHHAHSMHVPIEHNVQSTQSQFVPVMADGAVGTANTNRQHESDVNPTIHDFLKHKLKSSGIVTIVLLEWKI